MRNGGTFNVSAIAVAAGVAPLHHSSVQQSPWKSPVPYLFGGLAAMLGLIAFALLILACSYWKFSGSLENRGEGSDNRDLENGDDQKSIEPIKSKPYVYEEKIVVIMAGDKNPSFLATPISSRVSSFVDQNNRKSMNYKEGDEKLEDKVEELKAESSSSNLQEQNENQSQNREDYQRQEPQEQNE